MLKFLYHTCVSRGWNFKPLTGSQKPSTLGLSGGERNSVIDSVVLTQYEIDDRDRQQVDKHFLTAFPCICDEKLLQCNSAVRE